MYIRSLQIDNFMRLTAFNMDAGGKHVIIRGQNGLGKTSVVEAIWEALHGTSTKDRPEPVTRGADKALIRLDLGDYLVEKHIAADGKSRLVVKAADGSKISSPQKLLDGLLSQYSLDPVAFLDRRPQDQVDDVLRVCSIEPPVNQVELIVGEKCPPRPGESADKYMERLSADTVGEWYTRRRDQHRVVETNRGAVEKQQALVEQLDAKVTGEVRSTDVILADMEQATVTQKAYDSAKAGVAELERDQDSLNEKWGQVLKEKESLGNEIVKLKALLATAYEKMEAVNARIEKGTKVRADLDKELAETRSLFAPMKDQTEIMRKLRQELQAVQGQQKQIIEQEQSQKRLVDLQAEYDASKQIHAKLDKQLEDLRSLRKQLLEGIDLGVDGLEVGQGELRLHGVTFKQASLAQKLRVSCAVAMKGNGALKLLRIDNGEHLDSESRGYLLKLADEQGWQVIMTCVADQAELGVEIVDQGYYDAVGNPDAQKNFVGGMPEGRAPAKRKNGKLLEDRHTAV